MEKPQYIHVNDLIVKVQRWLIGPDGIVVSVMVTGEHVVTQLMQIVDDGSALVRWEGFEPTTAEMQMQSHRASGDGPQAVHRLELTMKSEAFPKPAASLTVEESITVLTEQIGAMRAEVEMLRSRVEILENKRPHSPGE